MSNIYTGYKNLNLFAVYNVSAPTANKTGNDTLADINKYELKPSYIDVKFSNSSNDKTTAIAGTSPATFDDVTTVPEIEPGAIDTIHLEISSTKLKDANDTSFTYDRVQVSITKLNPSNYREIYRTNFTKSASNRTTDAAGVNNWTSGIYYVEVLQVQTVTHYIHSLRKSHSEFLKVNLL